MKSNKQILMIFFLSIMFLIPFTINVNAQNICFTQEDSKRLVIELERGRLIEKNLILLEQQNQELVKQIDILKQQNQLLQEQFQAANELLKKNEELNKLRIDGLENDLKEAKKPRWGSLFSSFSLGALSAFAVILLF